MTQERDEAFEAWAHANDKTIGYTQRESFAAGRAAEAEEIAKRADGMAGVPWLERDALLRWIRSRHSAPAPTGQGETTGEDRLAWVARDAKNGVLEAIHYACSVGEHRHSSAAAIAQFVNSMLDYPSSRSASPPETPPSSAADGPTEAQRVLAWQIQNIYNRSPIYTPKHFDGREAAVMLIQTFERDIRTAALEEAAKYLEAQADRQIPEVAAAHLRGLALAVRLLGSRP